MVRKEEKSNHAGTFEPAQWDLRPTSPDLSVEEIRIDDKTILYIYVLESSQMHRCNGKLFDRNEDGDFDINANNSLVSVLFLRKQTSYSENRI